MSFTLYTVSPEGDLYPLSDHPTVEGAKEVVEKMARKGGEADRRFLILTAFAGAAPQMEWSARVSAEGEVSWTALNAPSPGGEAPPASACPSCQGPLEERTDRDGAVLLLCARCDYGGRRAS